MTTAIGLPIGYWESVSEVSVKISPPDLRSARGRRDAGRCIPGLCQQHHHNEQHADHPWVIRQVRRQFLVVGHETFVRQPVTE